MGGGKEKPAPWGLLSRPGGSWGPTLPPDESQGLQGLGLFTLFICFSGKVENIRASSHVTSRGVARALQRRLAARGLKEEEGVPRPLPRVTSETASPPATEGQSCVGVQAAARGGPPHLPSAPGGAPRGGAEMGPHRPQPTGRVCEPVHRCASGGWLHPGVGCPQEGNPAPLTPPGERGTGSRRAGPRTGVSR